MTNSIQSANDLAEKGFLLLNNKHFTQAENLFQQAISRDKNCPKGHQGLGEYYRIYRRYTLAKNALKLAYQIEKYNAFTLSRLGIVYYCLGKTEKAERLIRESLLLGQDATTCHYANRLKIPVESVNADHFFQQGFHFYTEHKLHLAKENFDKAIKINKNHFRSKLYRGIILKQFNQIPEAKLDLVDFLNYNPQHFEGNIYLASCYIQQNHCDKALQHIETCLTQHPESIDAHLIKGQAYTLLEEYRWAIPSFHMVLRLLSELKQRDRFSFCRFKIHLVETLKHLTLCLQYEHPQNTDDIHHHLNKMMGLNKFEVIDLGYRHLIKNDYTKAEQIYTYYLYFFPDDLIALKFSAISRHYLSLENPKQILDKIMSLDPSVVLDIGLYHMNQEDYTKAKQVYAYYLTSFCSDIVAHHQLYQIYKQEENYVQAYHHINKIYQLRKGDVFILELLLDAYLLSHPKLSSREVLCIAKKYYFMKEYEKAKNVLSQYPSDPNFDYYMQKANVNKRLKNYPGMESNICKAEKIADTFFQKLDCLSLKAKYYINLNQLPQSIQTLKQCLSLYTEHHKNPRKMYIFLSKLHFLNSDHDEAIAAALKSTKYYPKKETPYIILGLIRLCEDNFIEASTYFQKALKQNKKNIYTNFCMGELLRRQTRDETKKFRYQQITDAFSKALEANKNTSFFYFYFYRAIHYLENNQLHLAYTDMKSYMAKVKPSQKTRPSFVEEFELLAKCFYHFLCIKHQDSNEAMKEWYTMFAYVIEQSTFSAEIQETLLYLVLKQPPDLSQITHSLAKLDSNPPNNFYNFLVKALLESFIEMPIAKYTFLSFNIHLIKIFVYKSLASDIK